MAIATGPMLITICRGVTTILLKILSGKAYSITILLISPACLPVEVFAFTADIANENGNDNG